MLRIPSFHPFVAAPRGWRCPAVAVHPHLPRKIADRQEDRVRPCVGAAMCIDSIDTSGAAYCIHNPSRLCHAI